MKPVPIGMSWLQRNKTMKEYFKNKTPIDEIPKQELSDYLSADLKATQELSDVIYKKLNTEEYAGLMNTVVLTNRVSVTLARYIRMVLLLM